MHQTLHHVKRDDTRAEDMKFIDESSTFLSHERDQLPRLKIMGMETT